jgi:hypothetical protein
VLKNYRQVCWSMLPGLLELDGVPTPPSSLLRGSLKQRSGYAKSMASRLSCKGVSPHYLLHKADPAKTPLKSASRLERLTPKVGITMLSIFSPPELTPLKKSPFHKLSDSEISLSSSDDLQTYTLEARSINQTTSACSGADSSDIP